MVTDTKTMNYAIIAAGEGSRLAKEGVSAPKPMVTVNGEKLIDRLINVFIQNEAESISIIINEESPELEAHLKKEIAFPLNIVKRSTPSSLHSFGALLENLGNTESICLTTTDTVFREDEFKSFISAFHDHPKLDGMMAVTSFIDDESPLFVRVGANGLITAFTDTSNGETAFVSGGIYCLRIKAIETVSETIARGTNRMRNFQRQLLYKGLKMKAFEFSKIVDVDHVQDIRTAELFLKEEVVL
jgi:NDP-sugar pyrophosphorylase family protein